MKVLLSCKRADGSWKLVEQVWQEPGTSENLKFKAEYAALGAFHIHPERHFLYLGLLTSLRVALSQNIGAAFGCALKTKN